jgi:hypothetical protein
LLGFAVAIFMAGFTLVLAALAFAFAGALDFAAVFFFVTFERMENHRREGANGPQDHATGIEAGTLPRIAAPGKSVGASAARRVLRRRGQEAIMAKFIDVHTGMKGIDQKTLAAEHAKDTQIEKEEGVKFLKAWADPTSGKVFCLSEAPNKDAVLRVHKRAGHETTEIYEVAVEV